MISKLIVWGRTRVEAIERMTRALSEYRIGGIKTNLPFHRRVMQNEAFRRVSMTPPSSKRIVPNCCAPMNLPLRRIWRQRSRRRRFKR